jgi:hypothetical protein
MRARSGTVRNIYAEHALWKVRKFSAVDYWGQETERGSN